ncbi:hypothetical protein [Halobacillus seohaensis]|uniref:Lipoprotein n=1 Tax=Halobacillus seohaensis TaxID=447421 RepID=A0ABW2EDL3_9BACI
MKKWLMMLGITSMIVAAGCGSNTEEDSSTSGDSDNNNSEESSNDETATKKEILNIQQEMVSTFRPEQSQIADYEAAIGAEKPDEEAIKDAGEAAKSAAANAATKVEQFSIEGDLSNKIKEQYEKALPSLQAYYEEVETALDESLTEADLTEADKKFEEFQDQVSTIYEEADLLSTNLKSEFS